MDQKPPEYGHIYRGVGPYPRDRRKGRDVITRMIQVIGWIAWLLSIAFILFITHARPVAENFFSSILGVRVASGWDWFYLSVAFCTILATLVVTLLGIIFNMMRHKRKTDRFNKSLIVLFGVSLAALVWFLIAFGLPF